MCIDTHIIGPLHLTTHKIAYNQVYPLLKKEIKYWDKIDKNVWPILPEQTTKGP